MCRACGIVWLSEKINWKGDTEENTMKQYSICTKVVLLTQVFIELEVNKKGFEKKSQARVGVYLRKDQIGLKTQQHISNIWFVNSDFKVSRSAC